MGYRAYLSRRAKCPLFERAVYSGDNFKIAGVQCECIDEDFGVESSVIVRVKGRKGLQRLMDMYCTNYKGYEKCPYYQAYIKAMKK